MDNQFEFFYPILEEAQTDFEGRPHTHEVFCEGHIIFNGRLMCKDTMEAVMSKVGAKKKKVLPKRTAKGLCKVCLDEYRNNPDSAYYQFIHGKPAEVTSMERAVVYETTASA